MKTLLPKLLLLKPLCVVVILNINGGYSLKIKQGDYTLDRMHLVWDDQRRHRLHGNTGDIEVKQMINPFLCVFSTF